MGWLLPLTYTRPKHVDAGSHRRDSEDSATAASDTSNGSVKSGNSGASVGIPSSLTFDKIMNGGTCPPMTVRDFMNYLVYIEHSAENLQFFLWFRDYQQRFENAQTSDVALAQEWTQAMEDDAIAKVRKINAEKMKPEPKAAEIFKGTDFEKQGKDMPLQDIYSPNPFNTPPRTPYSATDVDSMYAPSSAVSSAATTACQVSTAFANAGVRQPFTIQPFREEVNRIIATYIMDGAPRQLNLSSSEQKVVVQALSHTTHPTAFRGLVRNIEGVLRHQAHPNFVRWSICNGNPARVFFARALGVGLIVAGLVIAVLLTLSGASRGYRAVPAIAFVLGISTLVAAYKGMCVVLHGMHHRHVRPWELFVQEEGDANESGTSKGSFESFGSSNNYEEEPWVVKYEKRNVVRKIFDREVWIQEPALRQIQDTIFVQAMLAALLGAGALTAIFVAVPGADLF
ncbi:Regulator of G protein signaling superfamily [Sarocladium implicatum]|nr:Regulator of G protein signaling superfamily [Sarocladium implicatum]